MKFTLALNDVSVVIDAPASILNESSFTTEQGSRHLNIFIPEPILPEVPVIPASETVPTIEAHSYAVVATHNPDRSGWNKIMAIKYVRGATGMGLKDSKDAVERDAPNTLHIFDNLADAVALQQELRSTASDYIVEVVPSSSPIPAPTPEPAPAPAPCKFIVRNGRLSDDDIAFERDYATEAEALAVLDFFTSLHAGDLIGDKFYQGHGFWSAKVEDANGEVVRIIQ